jgi:chaperonin GroEL
MLLYDGKISTMDQIIHVLEAVSAQSKPIVVVAHEVEGEALATMVVNSVRGTLRALAVKAPGFGSERTEILRDMASLVGGKLFGTIDAELEDATLEDLGSCDKVVSNKRETTIIGGHGESDGLKLRIEQIKKEIEDQKSDFEKEKLHKRLSKLSGGVAVIRVGAQSEVEMKEKKDLFDDALLATKAALEEGIVPGGGAALYHCSKEINEPKGDEHLGYAIVMKACKSPMEEILKNAGLDYKKVFGMLDANYTSNTSMGYDVVSEAMVNMIEKGVIDPTKVTRIAIEKAVSVAGTLLTTECMIVEEPAENESEPKS